MSAEWGSDIVREWRTVYAVACDVMLQWQSDGYAVARALGLTVAYNTHARKRMMGWLRYMKGLSLGPYH